MTTSRLFANGCSFTDYCWPTWADYLGLLFDNYENVGQAGSDNACMIRRQYNKVKEGDTVVLLWSGWNRHVKWNKAGMPTPKNINNHWQYNYERWDKNWLVNFYDPMERFVSSMDNIQAIDYQSKVIGFTAYHFSAFPWMLGEIEKYLQEKQQDVYNSYEIYNNYLMEQNLEDFREINFNLSSSTKYNTNDLHPTPLCHFYYMKDFILPKIKELNISELHSKLEKMEIAAIKHQEHVLNGKADITAEMYYE